MFDALQKFANYTAFCTHVTIRNLDNKGIASLITLYVYELCLHRQVNLLPFTIIDAEVFPEGCLAFKNTSPNVVRDESHIREDAAATAGQQQDFQQTEESLVERLEQCVETLQLAERYEAMADIYRLLVPIYERRRNYAALARCYKTLHQGYNKILEVNCTGKRLLGTYYRVVFFGQARLFLQHVSHCYILPCHCHLEVIVRRQELTGIIE